MDAYDMYQQLDRFTTFTVTENHLKLLRRANVDWQGSRKFGAPCIDPKRPYGNSNVLRDIAQIIGDPAFEAIDYESDDYDAYMEDNADRLTRLHAETAMALQIALAVGQFKAGTYTRPPYTTHWAEVTTGEGQ